MNIKLISPFLSFSNLKEKRISRERINFFFFFSNHFDRRREFYVARLSRWVPPIGSVNGQTGQIKGTRSWCKCFFFLFCVDCPRPSVARRAPKRPLRFFLRQQMTHNDKLENFRLFFPSRSLQFVCFLLSFTAKNKISRLFLSLHFVILLLFLRALFYI
jgi:hypothetical protein